MINDLLIALIYIIPFICAGYIGWASMAYENWAELATAIALMGMVAMTLLGYLHEEPLGKNATLCVMFQLGLTIILGFLSLRQPGKSEASTVRRYS